MRSAGNFHPEWGYLAPAPSFMRTARVVLVAMAIGATAGAAVIISLVQRPAADAANTSIAAHALVTSVPVVDEPPVALAPTDQPALAESPMPSQSAVAATASQTPAANPFASNGAGHTKANSISQLPAPAGGRVAALSGPLPANAANAESPSTAVPDEAAADPDGTVKSTKKQRAAGTKRSHSSRPLQPLFSLFNARGGTRNSY
jgi:hypothetical protein